MLTGKEDLSSALIEAFIMEKGTREFYVQASKKSSNSEVRTAFEELAKWEQQHMAYLQSLYQSLQDDRELEEFVAFSRKVNAPLAESGIPVKDLEKRIETYAVKDEKDALNLAVNIEAKSFNLYKDLAKRAQGTEAKVIFEEMMHQETKHMDHLTKLRKGRPSA